VGVAAFALATGMATAVVAADNVPPTASGSSVQLAQGAGDEAVNDPLEGFNRVVFDVNEFFYSMFLRGPTTMYVGIVAPPVRSAVSNVLHNLSTPVILANDILQWEWDRAGMTLERFFINSTLGIGGILDTAADMGIERHVEDFGQTLAVWGVPEPFYLVLPLFGPSSPRDAVGKLLVDGYFDPLGLYLANTEQDGAIIARTGMTAVDEYSGVMDELDQIKKTSVDYYAAVRSMYYQKRNAEIRNGAEQDLPPIPDLGYELSPEPGVQPAAAGQPKAAPGAEELGADPSTGTKAVPVSALPAGQSGVAVSLK
jgi:phospholipid-binding lipoprotein MlaA